MVARRCATTDALPRFGDSPVQRLLNRRFRFVVEVRRCFVEREDRLPGQQRPRERDPLTLAARQATSAFPTGVSPLRQPLHEPSALASPAPGHLRVGASRRP